MKEFTVDEVHIIAKDILKKAQELVQRTATIIALHGELGAGKTTISQEIAKELGVKENIISPTFVIMKKYVTKDSIFKNLIHIDAYRLNHSDELLKLGWKDIIKNKENLVLVEWPENVPECFDDKVCHIHLKHLNDVTRTIDFK